jgi:two-component system OmpR family sensor kinase
VLIGARKLAAAASIPGSREREGAWRSGAAKSAVLDVEDAGPGLTPEDRERLFERFYRADESRSRESGGVGLGLSIVAAVTKAHGGTVEASSEPGNGARFRITLPLTQDES